MTASLPHVLVLGTGGTIAGSRAAAEGTEYASAVLPVDHLLSSLPGIASVARLSAEQIFQVDSVELGTREMLYLARIVATRLTDPSIDAVVVTHGTDTLEESAFLVNLVVKSHKPIVFLGSMRPADALGADGPDNLFDAISVAADSRAAGMGALVIMDDRIHSARDVTKTNTTRTDAFKSPYGPLGEVIEGVPHFVRAPVRRHTVESAFDIGTITDLPRVEVLMTHPDTPVEVLEALASAGARGIVHVGPGNGNISFPILRVLDKLAALGIVIVRASRVGSGIVTRNGAIDDDDHGFVAADDHHVAHARVLLALGLTRSSDVAQIQEYFFQH